LQAKYYDEAIYEARQNFLPTAESLIERIHTLPNALGPDLATLIAGCRNLKALAERVDENVGRMTYYVDGVPKSYVDVGRCLVDWLNLKDQAIWIVRFAAKFSNDFRLFVGVENIDYSHNLDEFSSHSIH